MDFVASLAGRAQWNWSRHSALSANVHRISLKRPGWCRRPPAWTPGAVNGSEGHGGRHLLHFPSLRRGTTGVGEVPGGRGAPLGNPLEASPELRLRLPAGVPTRPRGRGARPKNLKKVSRELQDAQALASLNSVGGDVSQRGLLPGKLPRQVPTTPGKHLHEDRYPVLAQEVEHLGRAPGWPAVDNLSPVLIAEALDEPLLAEGTPCSRDGIEALLYDTLPVAAGS